MRDLADIARILNQPIAFPTVSADSNPLTIGKKRQCLSMRAERRERLNA